MQTILDLGRGAHHLGSLGNQGVLIASFQGGIQVEGSSPTACSLAMVGAAILSVMT